MAEFTRTLAALNQGRIETDLSMSLKELVAAVRDTGKSGKITVTIEVAKDKTDARLIRISPDVKVKMPEVKPPANHFYLRENRLISIEDSQQQLDLGQPIPEPNIITIPAAQQGERSEQQ
jgi:hypothetical protein